MEQPWTRTSPLVSQAPHQLGKKLWAIILAISVSSGGNRREWVISAQSGISGLAAGQCCAGALNQQKTGDRDVCFKLPCAPLFLAQGSSVSSVHFATENCPVWKGSFAWATSRWLKAIWCFSQAGLLGGLYFSINSLFILFCQCCAVHHLTSPSPFLFYQLKIS